MKLSLLFRIPKCTSESTLLLDKWKRYQQLHDRSEDFDFEIFNFPYVVITSKSSEINLQSFLHHRASTLKTNADWFRCISNSNTQLYIVPTATKSFIPAAFHVATQRHSAQMSTWENFITQKVKKLFSLLLTDESSLGPAFSPYDTGLSTFILQVTMGAQRREIHRTTWLDNVKAWTTHIPPSLIPAVRHRSKRRPVTMMTSSMAPWRQSRSGEK